MGQRPRFFPITVGAILPQLRAALPNPPNRSRFNQGPLGSIAICDYMLNGCPRCRSLSAEVRILCRTRASTRIRAAAWQSSGWPDRG